MKKSKAILIDGNFDLAIEVKKNSAGLITSGLVVGDSVYQQQTLLLVANKGEIKDKPLAGVGLNSYILDDADSDDISQEISSQFTDDGMKVFEINVNGESIKIDASYEEGSSFR